VTNESGKASVIEGEYPLLLLLYDEALLHVAQLVGYQGGEVIGLGSLLGEVVELPFEVIDDIRGRLL